jgi:hypothetical protein
MSVNITGPRLSIRAAAPIVISLLFLSLYLSTVRIADRWAAGDYSLYIMHAMNLVHGTPYAETGYVFNPLNSLISPAAYPPGFPAILAPVYAIAGVDIVAFKIVNAIILAGVVFLSFRLAKDKLGSNLALPVALFVGISPAFFAFRDSIGSDIPFTFWCLAALLASSRAGDPKNGQRFLWLAAVSLFMALVTRTAGIALAGAVIADVLIARGPRWRWQLVTLLSAGCLAVLVDRLLHVDSGTYLGYSSKGGLAPYLTETALAYSEGIAVALGLSFGRGPNAVVLLVVCALVALGLLSTARTRLSASELFFAAYAVLLAAFPMHEEPTRYLLPVLPLFAIYGVAGAVRAIAQLRRQRSGDTVMTIGAVALLAILVTPYYAIHDAVATPEDSYLSSDSQAMFQEIERAVPSTGAVLARNPRVFALFTGRRFAIWPVDPTPASLWRYADAIDANYIVLPNHAVDHDEAAVSRMIDGQMTPIFANATFTLYRRSGPSS